MPALGRAEAQDVTEKATAAILVLVAAVARCCSASSRRAAAVRRPMAVTPETLAMMASSTRQGKPNQTKSALRAARAASLLTIIGRQPLTLSAWRLAELRRSGWTRAAVETAIDDLVTAGRVTIEVDGVRLRVRLVARADGGGDRR